MADEACRMPSHMAYLVGGPKDGERMVIGQFLDVLRIAAPPPPFELDPVIAEMEMQFPTKMAADGDYRPRGWAKVTHGLPWCSSDHYIIEYLWDE